MSSIPKKRKGETGPKGAEADVRGSLLAAGKALISDRGLQPISLREVAERAAVNQAMVRYYFGDKKGYLSQLLDEGVDRLVAATEVEGLTVEELLRGFISALNGMPWLSVLLSQTVYLSDELREDFVRRHSPRLIGGLTRALRAERPVLDRLDVLLLVSMLIYPQIARPLVGLVFETELDDVFAARLAERIAGLMTAAPVPREV